MRYWGRGGEGKERESCGRDRVEEGEDEVKKLCEREGVGEDEEKRGREREKEGEREGTTRRVR